MVPPYSHAMFLQRYQNLSPERTRPNRWRFPHCSPRCRCVETLQEFHVGRFRWTGESIDPAFGKWLEKITNKPIQTGLVEKPFLSPSLCNNSSACFPRIGSLEPNNTFIPGCAFARPRQIANPIPLFPPVTRAVWNISGICVWLCCCCCAVGLTDERMNGCVGSEGTRSNRSAKSPVGPHQLRKIDMIDTCHAPIWHAACFRIVRWKLRGGERWSWETDTPINHNTDATLSTDS